MRPLLNCIPQNEGTASSRAAKLIRSTTLDHTPGGTASAPAYAYALYSVSKKASATRPTIVGPTGLDWPSP